MKCPNRNCIEGDIPETTSDTEHLPLICPDCQKRFCPSPLCGNRELNEDNVCRECGKHFPEHPEEEKDEGGSWKEQKKSAASGSDGFEDFMNSMLKKR